MRKLSFFSLIILFAVSNSVNAQDETAAVKPLNGDERCWGMNFMWQRDFTVGKQSIGMLNYNPSTPDDEKVTGFGLDWYLGPKSSINLLGSFGIGSDKTENASGKNEISETEIGVKASWNYYPLGMDKPVYWSVGPWVSFISYSYEDKNTPTSGTESKNEFSASRIGFGANASAYVKPWDNLNWEFYAGYNLGAFVTPESTTTTTTGGETKGPSSFRFEDCGGMVGTRFYFDTSIR